MIAAWRGYPQRIRMDNGPELISRKMADWAAREDVELAIIQPGKPAQNAYIERFNRTFHEDVFDAFLFSSLQEAREITELGSRSTTPFVTMMPWMDWYPINMLQPSHDFLLPTGTKNGMLIPKNVKN